MIKPNKFLRKQFVENSETIDFCIDKLTELLLKQHYEDKKTGRQAKITKVNAYRDLIKFLKNIKNI